MEVKPYNETEQPDGYKLSSDKISDPDRTFTLTIEDIKKFDDNLSDGCLIEVVYKAHLNENAKANTATDTDTSNENDVKLQYSNNPNINGWGESDNEHGETPKDSVWVFTYESDNSKVQPKAGSPEETEPLKGATFQLFKSGSDTAIDFYTKEIEGTTYYIPYDDTINSGSGTAHSPNVVANGGNDENEFKFKGLDAGTYTLKETVTPNGYNTCPDTTITITANHEEYAEAKETKLNNVDLTGSSNMNNDVLNQKGASLPSAGGIGTTLFYLGGGALVAVAGVMLITKKRMTKE